MEKLNKDKHYKISEDCGLAYIRKWGIEPPQYVYVVYVKTSSYAEGIGEVMGQGESIETALIEAIKNLVCLGLKSLPIEYIKRTDMEDFLKCLKTEKGHIGEIDYQVLPIAYESEGSEAIKIMYTCNTSICEPDDEGNVYPIFC